MPLYEYRCEQCGHQFERIQRFSDPPVSECPKCQGGPVVKLLSSPAIQFKGSGWYITDYARKNQTGASSAKSEGSSGETKKTESKESGGSAASSTPTPSGSTPPSKS